MKLGNRTELFVDNYLVESKDNVRFEVVHPKKEGEVWTFNRPWSDIGSLGCTVLEFNDKVYFYYRGFPGVGNKDTSPLQVTCVAVSEDGGKTFHELPVNAFDYKGITENNIVHMGSHSHNFMPFLDDNPNRKDEYPIKAIAGVSENGGIVGFGSKDGIHFEMITKPFVTKGELDSMNVAFYDVNAGVYRCYSRYYTLGMERRYRGTRAIQCSVSEDFINWSEPVWNEYIDTYDGCLDEHLYTNATHNIPHAEHMLLSIPMRFHEKRSKNYEDHPYPGVSDCILMTSRDGKTWSRQLREPWIYCGLDRREWTERNLITCRGCVVKDNLVNYYVEQRYQWDNCCISRFSTPLHRYGCLSADITGGEMVTKPLEIVSDKIYVNYSTSAMGDVVVEVLDMQNNVIEGYSADLFNVLYGNEIKTELLWKDKDFAQLKGKTVKLRIKLRDAKIYAIGQCE